jgi:hypothetical protein
MEQGWNDSTRLQQLWYEAPPSLRSVLCHLAQRPRHAASHAELAQVAFGGPDRVSRRKLTRLLADFYPRLRWRYAMATWPFQACWDPAHATIEYRMRADIATKLRRLEAPQTNSTDSSRVGRPAPAYGR